MPQVSLRHAVLAEVAHAPGRLHEIHKRLLHELGDWWPAANGQVLGLLQTWVKNGSVAVDTAGADGPVYAITRAGETELDRWFHSDAADPLSFRGELYLRLLWSQDHANEGLQLAVKGQRHLLLLHARRIRELRRANVDSVVAGRLHDLALEGIQGQLRTAIEWLTKVEAALDELIPPDRDDPNAAAG